MKKIKRLFAVLLVFLLSACELLTGYHLPHDLKDYKGRDYESVVEEFKEAGFTDVNTKVINDLTMGKADQAGKITSITFNDQKNFEKNDIIPIESKVVVTYHDLMIHNFKLHINFVGNWFFYKYDIDLDIGDDIHEKLPHGESKDLTYEIKEGDYTLKFVSQDDKMVKAQTSILITSDTEASYTVHCYGDRIDIEEDYINYKEVLEPNQVRMPCDKSAYVDVDYKEIVEILASLGFTNIVSKPVFDIRYGITLEESCANVTINESDAFQKGDIYDINDPIVVYYHMKEEDQPEGETPVEKEEISLDYAFKRSFGDFDVYYLFDKKNEVVMYFKSDEEGVIYGIFTGNLKEGIEMTFESDGSVMKEHFEFEDKKAKLYDAHNYSYIYEKIDVEEAVKVMKNVL